METRFRIGDVILAIVGRERCGMSALRPQLVACAECSFSRASLAPVDSGVDRERDAKALFEGAAEHRRAEEIRAFVDAVRAGEATCSDQARVSLDEWSAWARNIADEIDPALSRPYLK